MIIKYIRSIVTLSIALLIALLSCNLLVVSIQTSMGERNEELCIEKESNDGNDSLPDLLELEEEEELIVHEKRMGLIKIAAGHVLNTNRFGFHIEKIKIPEGDPKSPPPRC